MVLFQYLSLFFFFIQSIRIIGPPTINRMLCLLSSLMSIQGFLFHFELFSFFCFYDLKGPHTSFTERKSVALAETSSSGQPHRFHPLGNPNFDPWLSRELEFQTSCPCATTKSLLDPWVIFFPCLL